MLDSIQSRPAAFEMTTDIGVEQETGHPDLREAFSSSCGDRADGDCFEKSCALFRRRLASERGFRSENERFWCGWQR